MAPIRYSLHYEDYSEHLMSRFGKLLQMQSLVDMTLMCSSHTLRVHKAVLAASSAYFQEVLQKQTGEPLIILKMRFSVLKCLVEFMYCGKTQCLEENLDELVSAAQFLKIKGLSKVTKEGLGIANNSELPVFTPPVVISRPPQSLIDMHSQENGPNSTASQLPPASSTNQPADSLGHNNNKDMIVRIPFDIENGGAAPAGEYPDGPRAIKPRRGRPSVRRAGGWEVGAGSAVGAVGAGGAAAGPLRRAAERALQRREQDSRKAIHHLKHLQTRHMQDYMDRVTLSLAVNSICGPETDTNYMPESAPNYMPESTPNYMPESTPNYMPDSASNYMNIDNDLIFMDQTVSSNDLDQAIPYPKETIGSETITSNYSSTNTTNCSETVTSGINSAMSQYVNALKSAGLPTDLPILFESGDGSYINVNEQVLLDMVQSSEIQYEVIEQPNIIEKVADPSEIKSIDDLSKSIERGEILVGGKSYSSTGEYSKDANQFNHKEDTINSLNAILPDNLESFAEQQNYVVLDPSLQESNNSMDHVHTPDFSCIDGDMQFFTKSISDDVKKYYEDQQLNDSRVIEQLCPASTTLDTNFNISLLDTKISHLSDNLSQQYNPLNDMRRNEDCYDFGLQLPQSNVFKDDTLDCMMHTPKRNNDESNTHEVSHQLHEGTIKIIKDLMNIENQINLTHTHDATVSDRDNSNTDQDIQDLNVGSEFDETNNADKEVHQGHDTNSVLSAAITSSGIQWDDSLVVDKEACDNSSIENTGTNEDQDSLIEPQYEDPVIDLTEQVNMKAEQWENIMIDSYRRKNKENEPPESSEDFKAIDNDIPHAVGLLSLKQVQPTQDSSLLKRKILMDGELLDDVDAKCLKLKVKYKKL